MRWRKENNKLEKIKESTAACLFEVFRLLQDSLNDDSLNEPEPEREEEYVFSIVDRKVNSPKSSETKRKDKMK